MRRPTRRCAIDIIGSGFIARGLAPLAPRHPGVVAAAFGVSVASGIPESHFDREAKRLYDVVHRCMQRGEKVVVFSTASPAMYAVPGEPGREDGPVYPSNAYGRHNLALEAVVTASGVDHLIVRLAHVVGRAQPSNHLIPGLVRQIRSGTVRLFRGATRDLIDADDMVAAVDGLLTAGADRMTVNVVSGTAVPIEAIVDHLEEGLGVVAEREYVDTTISQPVSNQLLHQLVPELAASISDAHYYRRVIDGHLAPYVQPEAAPPPAVGARSPDTTAGTSPS